MGRCEILNRGNERCGSPQSKLNSMAKPLGGNDRVKYFLGNMATGTRVGYWSAWTQWLDFSQQRGTAIGLTQMPVRIGIPISWNSYSSIWKS